VYWYAGALFIGVGQVWKELLVGQRINADHGANWEDSVGAGEVRGG
jgi:hypothetical protein